MAKFDFERDVEPAITALATLRDRAADESVGRARARQRTRLLSPQA